MACLSECDSGSSYTDNLLHLKYCVADEWNVPEDLVRRTEYETDRYKVFTVTTLIIQEFLTIFTISHIHQTDVPFRVPEDENHLKNQ